MQWVRLAILLPFLAGCATTSAELTAWTMAREVDTPAAYQDFLRRYPGSSHADEAGERVETSKLERIRKAGTVAECVGIMKTRPDPKIAAQVAELALQAARGETSVPDLYDFLATFKGHPGAPEVRARLEQLEFEHASGENDPDAMEYFLLRYPESGFAGEGRRQLSEKNYERVKRWKHPYGYEAFLRKFPESPHAAEVRGWRKNGVTGSGSPDLRGMLAEAAGKHPWLKRYGCALALSQKIRNHDGEADALRKELYGLETGPGSGSLPESCSSVTLEAVPGAGDTLAGALRMLGAVEERRKELAEDWEVYGQRNEMVKAAVVASKKVGDEQETAELSEEVLGRGPLGGLDVGQEKASVSAGKALERFRTAEKMIERDREEIRQLLLETDGVYRPLRFAVSSGLVAK